MSFDFSPNIVTIKCSEAVFAVSGFASHFANQIDPTCDAKRHMPRKGLRIKINQTLLTQNIQTSTTMAMD